MVPPCACLVDGEVRRHPIGVDAQRSSDSPTQCAAEAVARSSARSAGHSACHAPAARSSSPLPAAVSSVATSPGACIAAARAEIAAIGLCLWASTTSHRRPRPALPARPRRPGRGARRRGRPWRTPPRLRPTRRRCRRSTSLRVRRPGATGRSEALGEGPQDRLVRCAERRAVAARAAEPDRLACGAVERAGGGGEAVAPPAGDRGERRRHGVLAERAGDHRVAPSARSSSDGGPADARRRSSATASAQRRTIDRRRRVDDVLAGAPRWT